MKPFLVVFFSSWALMLWGQSEIKINGPMLGYNTSNKVAIWVQTSASAEISISYADTQTPAQLLTTPPKTSTAENSFVLHFDLENLQPQHTYNYNVLVNGKLYATGKKPLTFQTASHEAEPEFCVATGSCACLRDKKYKNSHYGYELASGYGIYKKIARQKPDYMLWLGDNVYLRNGEWNSQEGVNYRYTHTRSLPQMQNLLRNTHHFATWDDHDYGENNGNQFSKGKDFALNGFELFWRNPPTHPQTEKGIYYNYRIGDAEFFLTDDRYFRDPDRAPDTPAKHFLGEKQMNWLLDELEKSTATFKFICVGTQVLNTNPLLIKESYWRDYPTEANFLLSEIKKRKIQGVVFLTGDVHHTVLSKYTQPDFYPLYDLTVSAFTSVQNPFWGTKNPLRVRGTFLWNHNFALLKFKGKGENRRLYMEIRDKLGIRRWKREIFAKDLRF